MYPPTTASFFRSDLGLPSKKSEMIGTVTASGLMTTQFADRSIAVNAQGVQPGLMAKQPLILFLYLVEHLEISVDSRSVYSENVTDALERQALQYPGIAESEEKKKTAGLGDWFFLHFSYLSPRHLSNKTSVHLLTTGRYIAYNLSATTNLTGTVYSIPVSGAITVTAAK